MLSILRTKRFSITDLMILMIAAILMAAGMSYAVTVPNTFVAGTPSSATDMNANFTALVDAVTAIENSNVMAMNPYITVDAVNSINGLIAPHVMFHDANIHVQDGSGDTAGAINGLGNLLIGYNENGAGFIPGERDGSHNLLVGEGHRYSSYGGFVAGYRVRPNHSNLAGRSRKG